MASKSSKQGRQTDALFRYLRARERSWTAAKSDFASIAVPCWTASEPMEEGQILERPNGDYQIVVSSGQVRGRFKR